MSLVQRLRLRAGALVYDWPAFERRLRGSAWLQIRNREERVTSDGRGVRCEWRFTSDLHLPKVFPSAGVRLMRRAFREWPIVMTEEPPVAADPDVTFLIGHRGIERLPHLLATLRSIAGQRGAEVECVVVEQSAVPEVDRNLPRWVRYLHTHVAADHPYNRAWAFNAGARLARSRVLIFHDNDMLVPASYAAEALARIGEGWMFLDLKRFLFYLSSKETKRVLGGNALRFDVPTTIVQNARGGSIAVMREAFVAIGEFDEAFVGWGGEDNDFWDRAEVAGKVYRFGYLPMIHLDHPFQRGKWSDESEAVARYRTIESIPPEERIARLLDRKERP